MTDSEIKSNQNSSVPIPEIWEFEGDVPDAAVQSARLLRERLLADPWRPKYHFCPPEDIAEPGDPNGAFYSDGRYHLMYLYNRKGSGFCWGHISSSDLLHWRHHPDSIGPGDGDEGCFSGGGFVDEEGTAYLSYWMLWGARGIGLARSADPDFNSWIKFEANPIIKSTEFGITEILDEHGKAKLIGSADPSNIWKKDGLYYMLTGNLLVLNKIGREPEAPVSEQGDRLYLFESADLQNWNYRHIFYERDLTWTEASEDNMCPSFLPLPSSPEGGYPSGKYLLLFISHNRGCQYYIGTYANDHFLPEKHGRMTWMDNTYFAPEALIDGQGRQIMWAWLTDNPGGEKEKGWSGVYGLPRTLWLGEDGSLRMRPVQEIEILRSHPHSFAPIFITQNSPSELNGVIGDACEIELIIQPGDAVRVGLKVRCSPDESEYTSIYFDTAAHELVFDAEQSGVAGRKIVERAPLHLALDEKLHLRVFIDCSIIEVFANDRQAIGRRVYPGRLDSLGVFLTAEGGSAQFETIKFWKIEPTNPF